jgi:Na+/H+ antiporter NhaD/arsenite permease-like protein
MLGMMTGMAYLQFFSFYLKKTFALHSTVVSGSFKSDSSNYDDLNHGDTPDDDDYNPYHDKNYDIFHNVARAEWDTLLFFYGVVLCVGGLGFIGYLELASHAMYLHLGATTANVHVGFLSAIVDNIPVMFAVLSMQPDMSQGQWLLVTLTAGVGGSMLSIGSAAGVALMGQAKGFYTFFGHLKWTWAIALGYALSILSHMWLNKAMF